MLGDPSNGRDQQPPRRGGLDTVTLTVDGRSIEVHDDSLTLLDALRDVARVTAVKDGCSPQGQCGCCTVLVDGAPRVACVTPVRRLAGRQVVTAAGLDAEVRDRWADAFTATGASQCGFCTPGIVCRLVGGGDVDRGLLAHLCRCTGWQTIRQAAALAGSGAPVDALAGRDPDAAARRATIEGGVAQGVGRHVALGGGGFSVDSVPAGALVAVPGDDGWVVGESLADARRRAGKVQGRRTTLASAPPLEVPDGDWDVILRTSWVEPAYLEPDLSWCDPGGEPAGVVANGGAFGGKSDSPLGAVARRLADEHGRTTVAVWSREDVTRHGPKRPPIAAGVRRDGSGVMRVARTPGIAAAVAAVAPRIEVVEVDVAGPPTSAAVRGAGWVEATVLLAGARGEVGVVEAPGGGRASASVGSDGSIAVMVAAGDPLDEVVLRSYAIGATHMALSWVTSESLTVDAQGEVHDLTIRSFGILRAVDMPAVEVTIDPTPGPPVNGSDAVFAAVAAAVWLDRECPPRWPC